MNTLHQIVFGDSRELPQIPSESVQLVVTSPPYPMIEMWDELFIAQSPEIRNSINRGDGSGSFELMHKELDKVWGECYRVLNQGGFICINIGDATRSLNKEFQLFSNHTRIITTLLKLGFQILPEILWRKQTNAPNKFMGSGMLPAGAYVTLEHEFILIARKNGKRLFQTEEEKMIRQKSAFFWEERNIWFSDIWDNFKGTTQKLKSESTRERSAAFPFELAYRLINMYSVKGDVVVDPFLGTGTTILASIASERNTIGYEIDEMFQELINERILSGKEFLNSYILERIRDHEKFIEKRIQAEKELKYVNENHSFQVVTKQEEHLHIRQIKEIIGQQENKYEVFYE